MHEAEEIWLGSEARNGKWTDGEVGESGDRPVTAAEATWGLEWMRRGCGACWTTVAGVLKSRDRI